MIWHRVTTFYALRVAGVLVPPWTAYRREKWRVGMKSWPIGWGRDFREIWVPEMGEVAMDIFQTVGSDPLTFLRVMEERGQVRPA